MDTPRPYQRIALFVAALALVFGAAGGARLAGRAGRRRRRERRRRWRPRRRGRFPRRARRRAGGTTRRARRRRGRLRHSLCPDPVRAGEAARAALRGRGRRRRAGDRVRPAARAPHAPDRRPPRRHRVPPPASRDRRRRDLERAGPLAEAGVYRAFADFSVDGEQHTLGEDLFVSGGEFESRPFPAPRPVDAADGYQVRLRAGDAVAGEPAPPHLRGRENRRPVDDLQPYLGAKGHLVALREGDLAFLHVHPEETEAAADEIAFEATFPTAGRYRLYLQFGARGRRADGAVHDGGAAMSRRSSTRARSGWSCRSRG